jgi:hypothetical protein
VKEISAPFFVVKTNGGKDIIEKRSWRGIE